VRAAGVLAKGRMFDMPALRHPVMFISAWNPLLFLFVFCLSVKTSVISTILL